MENMCLSRYSTQLTTYVVELMDELSNIEKGLQKVLDSIKVRDVCEIEVQVDKKKKEVIKGIYADSDIIRRICSILGSVGFRGYDCSVCYTAKGMLILIERRNERRILTLADFAKIVKDVLELENKAREVVKNDLQQLLRILQSV